MKNYVRKSPYATFLKFLLCGALVFGAFVIGDNIGYKRGFQETASYTLAKIGIDVSVNNHEEYSNIIDSYLEENKSIGKSIENILSSEEIGNTVGDMVTDFLDALFGK